MLGSKVELHVANKPLWLGHSSSMRQQLGVVLLWPNVEVTLLLLLSQRGVVMSLQDGVRDVDILPSGLGGVHQGLALVQPHELLVRIPMMLATSS